MKKLQDEKIDIVIPLGSGSTHYDFELRLALRSIARCAISAGSIYIVSSNAPRWLQNVKIIDHPDRYKHNKDGNIIEKLKCAASLPELSSRFIFWSDDQLALKKFDCRRLLPVYNMRGKQDFSGSSIWHRRMRSTFDHLAERKKILFWNWESHVPQPYCKEKFLELMDQTDYKTAPGLAVNTTYFGLLDTPPHLPQNAVKTTLEKVIHLPDLPTDKLFLGYNDAAMRGNLPALLLERFPEPCGYEKTF